jgi:TPR repeat protein
MLLIDAKGLTAVAQQTFRYNSYFQDLSLSELATVKADGRIIPVDARAINDQPAFTDPSSPYYDEARIRTISYPDVAPGDKVRGRLVYSSKRSRFPGEYANYWIQPENQPPEVIELTLTGPAAKPLHVAARGVEHSEQRIGKRIVHHVFFRQQAPKALLSQTDGFDTARRFEVSTFQDYAAFAAMIRAWNAPMAVPDETVRRFSAELVGDATSERDKAERIYNWVARHIRYVGIGFEDGGYTSQPAAAILASRYGDCKAHVTILKALLAAQGIQADFVIVNAGPAYTLTSVATDNFDHAIAYLSQFDLYLDPTSSTSGYGSLPVRLYGKPVLNVDKGVLASIPLAKPDDFLLRADTSYTLGPEGLRKAESTLFGAGIGANVGRTIAQYLEHTDRARVAAQNIKSAGLEGSGDYVFSDPRAPSGTFTISAPFEIAQPISLQERAYVRLLAYTDPRPSLRQLIAGGVRDKAFRCSSLDYTETASIRLPDGTNVEGTSGPLAYTKDLAGQTSYGSVAGRIDLAGSVAIEGREARATAHIRVVFDAPVCPPEFAEEIKSALVKWDRFWRRGIAITPQPVWRVVEWGSSYETGLTAYRRKDYGLALKEFKPLAEQGDKDAQAHLGWMYENGQGVAQDYALAVEWYTKAAEQGQAWAQSELGDAYDKGLGVPKDAKQALEWFRKGAEGGNAYAQCMLGQAYDRGKVVPQDYGKAMELYAKAAAQGNTWAEQNIGAMYAHGKGVPRDYGRAAEWYRKAADKGYSPAQVDLGTLYAYGRGVPQDYKQALDWYHRAANRGTPAALYNIGYAYEQGYGVEADPEQAREWYRKAAGQGYAAAQDRLDAMTPAGRLIRVLRVVVSVLLQ